MAEKTPDCDWWNRAYRHDPDESCGKSKAVESGGIQWPVPYTVTVGMHAHRRNAKTAQAREAAA
jgi:hypothetical protein